MYKSKTISAIPKLFSKDYPFHFNQFTTALYSPDQIIQCKFNTFLYKILPK